MSLQINEADGSLHTGFPLGTKPGDPDPIDGNFSSVIASSLIDESSTGTRMKAQRTNGSETAVQVDMFDTGTGTCTSGADYNAISAITPSWADGISGVDDDTFFTITTLAVSADCTIILGFQNATSGFTVDPAGFSTFVLTVQDSPPPATGSDTEFGPQISGGLCPNIPTGAADHTVTTEAELTTALSALDGVGGIIEISDGTYSFGSVTIDKGGLDDDNHIYIRSETLYGATINTGTWTISKPFVTISGFDRAHTGTIGYFLNVTADNNRIACLEVDAAGSASVYFIRSDHSNTDNVDDFELDNNRFLGFGTASTYVHFQCVTYTDACQGVAQRHHIHHNLFNASGTIDDQAFELGLAWSPQDPDDAWNDTKNQSNHLIENNHFQWLSGFDPVLIKTSKNIIRFNCLDAGTRVMHNRMGNDNLFLGNWYKGPVLTQRYTSGWGVFRVFNYTNTNGDSTSQPLHKLHAGTDNTSNSNLWNYMSASEGTYSNNVCDGCDFFIWQMAQQGPLLATARKPKVINSLFQNNLIRASSTPSDYTVADSHTNEATFKTDNTFGSNSSNSGVKGNVACFTSSHVEGLGTSVTGSSRLSSFDGTIDYSTSIPAPSWFN